VPSFTLSLSTGKIETKTSLFPDHHIEDKFTVLEKRPACQYTIGMSAAGSQSRATETVKNGRNQCASCAATIRPIPIAPIAAIAIRARRVSGRNHEPIPKKEKKTRFIHSAVRILTAACGDIRLHE